MFHRYRSCPPAVRLWHRAPRRRATDSTAARSRPNRILLTLPALTLALSACSAPAPDSGPDPVTPEFDPDIAALVPESVSDDGALRIGTDPNYPPMEFTMDAGYKVVGFDIDLATGIAAVLGLTPHINRDAYTAIPAGVRAGRHELGIASITIRKQKPRLTDAVIYFMSGSQLVRSVSSQYLDPDAMCGSTIAVLEGSVQVAKLSEAARSCRAAGLPNIEIEARSSLDAVTDAVISGPADGLLADKPVADLTVRDHPRDLEAVGPTFDKAPLGMITSRDTPKFTRAVKRALNSLIESGFYDQILRKWDVQSGSVDRPRIVRAGK